MAIALVTNVLAPYRLPLYTLLAARYDVEVLCFGAGADYVPAWFGDLDRQLEAAPFPARRIAGARAALALGRRYDAAIAPVAGGSMLPATYLAMRCARKPFVLWASVWAHPRTARGAVGFPLIRRIYRDADAVVTYGDHITRYVARHRGRDDDVWVAPQSVEAELFGRAVSAAEIAAWRREAGLPADGPLALYVGRLVPEKGVEDLLAAWRMVVAAPVSDATDARAARPATPPTDRAVRPVRDATDARAARPADAPASPAPRTQPARRDAPQAQPPAPAAAPARASSPNATLVVIGDGPLAAAVADTPHTRLLGPQPRERLPVAYAAADALALPSRPTPRFREPWGLVCNEALHQGTPVVATTAVGAVAGGLVRDGQTGLVVAPGDPAALAAALRRLLNDAPLRDRLGAAGRAALAGHTYEAMADAFGAALARAGALSKQT